MNLPQLGAQGRTPPMVATERLTLAPLARKDREDVFALHTDPRVWEHFPSGRHLEREQSERLIADVERAWAQDGLSYWLVRTKPAAGSTTGAAIGVAGVTQRPGPVWNLYYRLTPEHQGQGYALEVATAAISAATGVNSTIPVVAYLLKHNHGSRRIAERIGLDLVWQGPDRGNPDPNATRLIYADRPLAPELRKALAQRN